MRKMSCRFGKTAIRYVADVFWPIEYIAREEFLLRHSLRQSQYSENWFFLRDPFIFQLIAPELFEWLKRERDWEKFSCIEINWLPLSLLDLVR